MFIYHKIPQYYETDQMGIIHHSNHIRYFEEARLAYMDELGIGELIRNPESGVICPVLKVQAEYKNMIRLCDALQIYVRLIQYNGFRYTFGYEIRSAETLCCTGTTELCFMTQENQPVRMKRSYPELHETLCRILEKDTASETNS